MLISFRKDENAKNELLIKIVNMFDTSSVMLILNNKLVSNHFSSDESKLK